MKCVVSPLYDLCILQINLIYFNINYIETKRYMYAKYSFNHISNTTAGDFILSSIQLTVQRIKIPRESTVQ